MAQEMDQQFVDYVVKSMVDHPDDVTSERTIDEMGVLITLKVNPEDMGQLIGRQGQTAKSIRTLLRVIGAKNNARVNLKIIEPEGSEHRRRERPEGDRRDDRRDDRPRMDRPQGDSGMGSGSGMGGQASAPVTQAQPLQDPTMDVADDLDL